jgi:hypothetical protein
VEQYTETIYGNTIRKQYAETIYGNNIRKQYINYGFDFNPPLQMVLVTNSFQFRFFQKSERIKLKDGFGRNEGFQKTKVMVLGTNYLRKTKRRLKTNTMQKYPVQIRFAPTGGTKRFEVL